MLMLAFSAKHQAQVQPHRAARIAVDLFNLLAHTLNIKGFLFLSMQLSAWNCGNLSDMLSVML